MPRRGLLILLILSLSLNLFLLLRQAPAPRESSTSPPPAISPVSTKPASVQPPEAQSAQPVKTNALFHWADLESPDYKTFIDNLRAIGCPEQTVRDIIARDLENHYQKRKWKVLRSSVRTDFWSPDFSTSSTLDQTQLNDLLALNNEFRDVHRELLQAEPEATQQFMNLSSVDRETLATYGPLPEEKLQTISAHLENLRIQADWLAPGDPRLDELHAQTQEKILGLLSPDEREQYQLRTSPAASALRRATEGFELTEAEFRNTFQAIEQVRNGNPELKLEDIVSHELLRSLDPARSTDFLRTSAATENTSHE